MRSFGTKLSIGSLPYHVGKVIFNLYFYRNYSYLELMKMIKFYFISITILFATAYSQYTGDYYNPAEVYNMWNNALNSAKSLYGDRYRDSGIALANAHDHSGAIQYFSAALAQNNTAELHNLKGVSEYNLGNYEAALQSFETALSMKENDTYKINRSNAQQAILLVKAAPISISAIKIANCDVNSKIQTNFGGLIASDSAMFLRPALYCKNGISARTTITLYVKWYNENTHVMYHGGGSPDGYTYQTSTTLTTDGSILLEGYGWSKPGNWEPGLYRLEIWYGGVCIGSAFQRIYARVDLSDYDRGREMMKELEARNKLAMENYTMNLKILNNLQKKANTREGAAALAEFERCLDYESQCHNAIQQSEDDRRQRDLQREVDYQKRKAEESEKFYKNLNNDYYRTYKSKSDQDRINAIYYLNQYKNTSSAAAKARYWDEYNSANSHAKENDDKANIYIK